MTPSAHLARSMVGLALFAAGVLATGPTAARAQDIESPLSQIQSDDAEARLQARDSIQAWYEGLVDGLIAIVAEEREGYEPQADRKLLAVQLLGHLRAARAVQVLADNITFTPLSVIDEASLTAIFPSVGALIEIGDPAVVEMLSRLRDPQLADERVITLYVSVVVMVEREEVAAMLLREVADNLPGDSLARTRIEHLVSRIAPDRDTEAD